MAVKIIHDLRPMFGPVRDQGARPTCLAFATSDIHAALRGKWTPLSCEFVFYHAQRRGGASPHVGATINSMFEALRKDGQPVETDWPYLAGIPPDIKLWVPPKMVGPVFRRDGSKHTGHVDEIITFIDGGFPPLITMCLSDSFYSPDRDGVVRASSGELPDPARRHAMCAVAHGTVGSERAILVRNSWGARWGLAGHAWLIEPFLIPRLTCVAQLTKDINVSTN